MIARLKSRNSNFIYQTARGLRVFEGRKNRKLRKNIIDYHLDFTHGIQAQEYIKTLKKQIKTDSGFVPFSKALSQTKIPKSLPPYVELKKDQRRYLSKIFRKRLTMGITAADQFNRPNLQEKILYLDKTASVLENYRRIIEVKIFNRLLHREREKKLFLKMDSRKMENIIPDYDIRFKTFERWSNFTQKRF